MWHNASYHYRCTGLSQGLRSMGATNVDAWKQTSSSDNSLDNLSLYNADLAKFLCRYVTMDETWAHHFDHESKIQCKAWKHTTTSQIPQDCLRWHYYGISILGQWECSHDWLLGEGKDCYGQLLCGINQKTSHSCQRKATGKVESRCATSSRQCTSPHFYCCHSCHSRLRLQTAESPTIFSRPGSTWLPSLRDLLRGQTYESNETVIQTISDSFYTARWKVLCWWNKSTCMSLGKCIVLEEDYVEKL